MDGGGRRGERIRGGDKMVRGGKWQEQEQKGGRKQKEGVETPKERTRQNHRGEKKVGLKDEKGEAKGNAKEAVTGG